MKAMATAWLALGATMATAAGAGVPEPALAALRRRVRRTLRRIAVGTSRTELARSGAHWTIESTSTATGFARMIATGTLRQRSEFELLPDGPRPVELLRSTTARSARTATCARVRLARRTACAARPRTRRWTSPW